MLSIPSSVRIYLAAEPTDMRKGFDCLAALVTGRGLDVYSGHLFVFISKRRNRAKVLAWERGGFVLFYKRLERGRFKLPSLLDDTVKLDAAQLTMLLDGVDLAKVSRSRAWQPPLPSEATGIDKRSRL
jgi:transposase